MVISKHWGWAALPLVAIGAGLPVAAQFGSEYRGYAFLGVLVLLAAELAAIGWLALRCANAAKKGRDETSALESGNGQAPIGGTVLDCRYNGDTIGCFQFRGTGKIEIRNINLATSE